MVLLCFECLHYADCLTLSFILHQHLLWFVEKKNSGY
uniref:Uncharacterized protein n=1 Tax=Arundo donax TaxID=35708 RepID=A0A0A8Z9M5_ARUDO